MDLAGLQLVSVFFLTCHIMCSEVGACRFFILAIKCNSNIITAVLLPLIKLSCLCYLQEDTAASDPVPAVHHSRDRGESHCHVYILKY